MKSYIVILSLIGSLNAGQAFAQAAGNMPRYMPWPEQQYQPPQQMPMRYPLLTNYQQDAWNTNPYARYLNQQRRSDSPSMLRMPGGRDRSLYNPGYDSGFWRQPRYAFNRGGGRDSGGSNLFGSLLSGFMPLISNLFSGKADFSVVCSETTPTPTMISTRAARVAIAMTTTS